MSGTKKVGSLEVSQDLEFQQKFWVVQRIGWVMMALLVLLALLGLFGQGPLSRATVGSVDVPLSVEYDRFARFGKVTELRLELQPAAVSGDTAQVWLSQSYLERMDQIKYAVLERTGGITVIPKQQSGG